MKQASLLLATMLHGGVAATTAPLMASTTPLTLTTAPLATPAVLENCLPDPVSSLVAAVTLAVLSMLVVAGLVWMLASIPEAPSRALPPQVTAASTSLSSRGRRLDTLDGLRTVLVMYVVVYHVRWALPAVLAPWFQLGHWAVQFFFVLSGFVVACGHEAAVDADHPIGVDMARKMAVRRLTRLCPPYFAALLGVAAVAAYRGGGQPFLAWPIQALFLQSLLPVRVCGPLDVGHWSQNFLPFAANGEGWFVSAVLICSLCFPVIHKFLPRGGFRATLWALLLVVVARAVPTLMTMAGRFPVDAYTFAPVRLLEFIAGVLSAQLCREMPAHAADFGGWDWIFDASLLCAMLPVWTLGHWHRWATCEANHGDFFLTGVFCLTCIAARCMAEQRSDSLESAGRARSLDGHCLMRPSQADEEGKERGCEIQCGLRCGSGSPLAGLLASHVLVAPAMYSYQAYIFQEVFIAALTLLPRPQLLRLWWLPVPLTWGAAALSVHFLEEPLKRAVEARLAAAAQRSKA